MPFKGPYNINVVGRYPVRVFDGIGGDVTEVLRRFTGQGYDVSYTVSNEVYDLDLSKNGVAMLRDGSRKVSNAGQDYSIDGIFFTRVGGILAYGYIFNSTLSIVTIPLSLASRDADGITLTPATAISAPSSETIPSDPSYPS
jgi:hypothetical protein